MKIGVVTEFSTKARNADILKALDELGYDYVNIGLSSAEDGLTLTYIEISFMAAAAYHLNICDYIIGGCGTGQGFCICLNQFPDMMCGHIEDPLGAWLFTQINGGNAVSFMLNKDYGWAADTNLKFMIEKLFDQPSGSGFPKARAELQNTLRNELRTIAHSGKRPMADYVDLMTPDALEHVLAYPGFIDLVKNSTGGDDALRQKLLKKYAERA